MHTMKISNAHGKCKGRVGWEQHAIHELHGRVRGVLDGRAATRRWTASSIRDTQVTCSRVTKLLKKQKRHTMHISNANGECGLQSPRPTHGYDSRAQSMNVVHLGPESISIARMHPDLLGVDLQVRHHAVRLQQVDDAFEYRYDFRLR